MNVGPDENVISDIPGLAYYLQRGSLDWKYKTVPQPKACLAFNGNQLVSSLSL